MCSKQYFVTSTWMCDVGVSWRCSVPSSILVVKCNLYLQKGSTVLCIASYDGHDKIVELLLRRKADVNHQTVVRFQFAWLSWQYNYCPIYVYTCISLFRVVGLHWWLHLKKDTSILWACSWIVVHLSIYKIRYPQKSCKCVCVHVLLCKRSGN